MSWRNAICLLAFAVFAAPLAAQDMHDAKPPTASDAAVAGSPLMTVIAAAEPHATIHVPAGRYRGMLAIEKSVTLIADGEAILDGNETGDVVRINAPDVTLRGFRLTASGDSLDRQNCGILINAPRATVMDNTLDDVLLGVVLSNAADTVVRGNRIRGKPLDLGRRGDGIRVWSSPRTHVDRNELIGVRDVVVWYSQDVKLTGNSVTDSRYGMHFMYASGGVIEENRLSDNSVGVFLMYSSHVTMRHNLLERNRGPSGYGLGLKDVDGLLLEENQIVANRVGLYIDSSPSRADITHQLRRNTVAYNDIGLAMLPAVQRNHFSDNNFVENIEQVAILGSGELRNNVFAIAGRGNYWSDYVGIDAGGDGIGDRPYQALSLFESLMDREPKMRLFIYSPAQQAIELAAKAFPIMQPAPKITDDAPLTRAVDVPHSIASRGAGGSLAPGAAWMLGFVALLLAFAGAQSPARSTHLPILKTTMTHMTPPPPSANAPLFVADIVTISGLRKSFGRHAVLDGIDLRIRAGSAVALWGENGAGKTTIIKCILGLHHSSGEIRVGGIHTGRFGKTARRMIGYVSQELAFYDDLTTRDTVRLFARLKRVPITRGPAALERVGLSEHAGKRVGQLSGGMKQRLALAVALLADPPVLLLDEPTSNLDAAARRGFFELLQGLKRDGKTIIFTTHRADEIALLADRVVVLERGRVARDGPPGEHISDARLKLAIAEECSAPALAELSRAGFDAHRNGVGLIVRVPAGRNATPIAHLARAGFDVQAFELESGDHS